MQQLVLRLFHNSNVGLTSQPYPFLCHWSRLSKRWYLLQRIQTFSSVSYLSPTQWSWLIDSLVAICDLEVGGVVSTYFCPRPKRVRIPIPPKQQAVRNSTVETPSLSMARNQTRGRPTVIEKKAVMSQIEPDFRKQVTRDARNSQATSPIWKLTPPPARMTDRQALKMALERSIPS